MELFHPTAKQHAEEWPVLAQRLASGSLVLFPHVRLREELLNLFYEVGPQGVKVIDRGKVHQDHAVTVRGVVAMLAQRARVPQVTMKQARAAALANADLRGPSPSSMSSDEGDEQWHAYLASLGGR